MSLKNIEHEITTAIRAWGRPALAFFTPVAERALYAYLIVGATFVVLGWLVWWQALLPVVASQIAAIITQYTVHRRRPPFEAMTGYRMWIRVPSFPSGHATASASASFALLLLTHFPPSVPIVPIALGLFGLGILIGVSRIVVGVHYVGDVLVGYALGAAFAIGYAWILV